MDVYFYILSLRFFSGNVYVREICGRGVRNIVVWGLMILIVEGCWDSVLIWIKVI